MAYTHPLTAIRANLDIIGGCIAFALIGAFGVAMMAVVFCFAA